MAQRAKYLDIAASVLARLRNLPPGSRCPGVHQITCEYHVARATAERVLRHLTEQGHVQQIPGKGTFVAERFVCRIAIFPCAAEASTPRQIPKDAIGCGGLTEQITEALEEAGHEVQVMAASDDERGPAASTLAAASPELLVTIDTSSHRFLEDLARLGRPIVCVGYTPLNLPVDFVATATLRSSYMVTRALLEAGLTDTWYIGAEDGWPGAAVASQTHSIGFHAACRDGGLADIATRVRMARSDCDLDAIIRRFFSQAQRRRAVVTADACIGRRFLSAARRCGLRVPEDLAIAAASSRDAAEVSCLVPDPADLASAATELICRRIRLPDLPAQDVRVPPGFVDAGTIPAAAAALLRSMLARPWGAAPRHAGTMSQLRDQVG